MIASAVSIYAEHTGSLPATLDALTHAVVNAKGESRGPFLLSVPTAPAGSSAYRYDITAEGTYRVSGESHGEVVEFGTAVTTGH